MIESLINGVLLGVVQGLTEFLPISSDGHLVIIREVANIPDQGVFFDAILHVATLLAVLVYFRHDLAKLVWAQLRPAKLKASELLLYRKLFPLILVATLPAAIVGYLGRHFFEDNFRNIYFVGGAMILSGIVFWMTSRSKSAKTMKQLTVPDSLGFGLAQLLAVLPGVSRSGSMVSVGMFYGFDAKESARFAFLAGVPIFVLAGGFALLESILQGVAVADPILYLSSFIASFLFGLLAVKILMVVIGSRWKLIPFSIYMLLGGTAIIGLKFFNLI